MSSNSQYKKLEFSNDFFWPAGGTCMHYDKNVYSFNLKYYGTFFFNFDIIRDFVCFR